MSNSKYKIIFGPIPESALQDSIADFVGWNILSYIIPERVICRNISRVDWKIISSRVDLSDTFFQEHSQYLCWNEYLSSEKPKDINLLAKHRSNVEKYVSKLDNSTKRVCYLDPEFIDLFSEVIDWISYAKYIKIPEYLLKRYWTRFNPSLLSSSQNLTPEVYEEHWKTLDWVKISRYQKLDEKLINRWRKLVHWKEIFKYQVLTSEFLEKNKFNCKDSDIIIPAHQNLTDEFIYNNKNWLNMKIVCEKQNMSYELLKKIKKYLDFESLQKNLFYNNYSSIQIWKNPKTKQFFVFPKTNPHESYNFV